MKVGLCLSGGGTKGATHIGVLKAIEEKNIDISYISGCSSGSIVATLYACGYKAEEILEIFKKYCKYISDYNTLKLILSIPFKSIKFKGILRGKNLENLIKKYCGLKNIYDINQIKIPLSIPTVDLKTGEVIYFINKSINIEDLKKQYKTEIFDDEPTYICGGNISDIVRASCSYPLIFEPKKVLKYELIDGGIRENMPVKILKQMGADKIISVKFETILKEEDTDNAFEILFRSIDILSHEALIEKYKDVDILIEPKFPRMSLLKCGKEDYMFEQGYLYAKKVLDNVKM